MNNKGASILMMVFEVLAVVLIVGLAFNVATKYAESDQIVKVNTANDLALMINTLVALSGDALVQYPADLSEFQIYLNNERVLVKTKEDSQHLGITVIYNLLEDYAVSGAVKEKENVCLKKTAKTIIIEECPKSE